MEKTPLLQAQVRADCCSKKCSPPAKKECPSTASFVASTACPKTCSCKTISLYLLHSVNFSKARNMHKLPFLRFTTLSLLLLLTTATLWAQRITPQQYITTYQH